MEVIQILTIRLNEQNKIIKPFDIFLVLGSEILQPGMQLYYVFRNIMVLSVPVSMEVDEPDTHNYLIKCHLFCH